MKLNVSFKIVNPDFDADYAKEYNWGEPGPGNMKYHESWKYQIEDVVEFSQNDDAIIKIKGVDANDDKHEFQINNVFRLRAELKDGTVEEFHVSKSLIRNTHETKGKNGTSSFYFYLLIERPFTIINETSYVASEDIPEDIMKKEWKSLKLPNEVKSKLIEKAGSIPVRHD